MIYKEYAEKNALRADKKEILRYLGYKDEDCDEQTAHLVEQILNEMSAVVNPSACFTICDIKASDNIVDFPSFSVKSNSLLKNLGKCNLAVLFCATIGVNADRVIYKYSKTSPAKAVIAQAVGTALIEAWCDVLCEKIKKTVSAKGLFTHLRFSPGYGDFDLSYQKEIFSCLDCSKHIGVSLTEHLIMTPSKSVSGVVGLGTEDIGCTASGCEVCSKRNSCEYSRG